MMRWLVVSLVFVLSSCTGFGPNDLELRNAIGISVQREAPLTPQFTKATASLYLSHVGPVVAEAEFLFPGVPIGNTQINLVSASSAIVNLRVRCSGSARVFPDGGRGKHMRAGHWVRVVLAPNGAKQAYLLVGSGVTSCEISWASGENLRLIRQEFESLNRPGLGQQIPACTRPEPGRLDPLQTVFFAENALSQTCAIATESPPILLADPIDALNARIEALTGKSVPRALLLEGNPDMFLDFSQAPELERIYVSYLLMRADYTGYLMRRMLEWHAAQGVIIRIILTDNLMPKQDRALFENLAAAYPNVQLQFYQWSHPGNNRPSDAIDTVQRAHHIKVFATLSRDNLHSRIILGGRNLWDGFVFEHPFDLSAWPELRTYDENKVSGLTYHASYVDFEIELRGRALVAEILGQVSAYWHRDMRNQTLGPVYVSGQAPPFVSEGVFRHFLSLPWADARAQQDYFVALLDAAQDEILISTPFFYPPPVVLNALLRARARGVKVQVVAQISTDDIGAIFTNALNTGFLRRFGTELDILAFTSGAKILHSKMLLIDNRLAMLTSTNWNRRSFLHDTENGVVFLDRAVTAQLREVFNTFLARSTRIQPTDRPPLFDRVLLGLPDIWQYF